MKTTKGIELDEKKAIATINDAQLLEKIRSLGGLLYEENKITFIEAAYFAEKGALPLEKGALIKAAKKKDKLAEDKYQVVSYLRSNGYITRFSLDGSEYIRVYQKGFRPGEDRTKYLLKVVKSDLKSNVKEIEEAIVLSNRLRKELVFAYVKDGIKFIKINRMNF